MEVLMEMRTDMWQVIGNTVFILKETGKYLPKARRSELCNATTIQISGDNAEQLAVKICKLLNAENNELGDGAV
jgi:hypothetical protein